MSQLPNNALIFDPKSLAKLLTICGPAVLTAIREPSRELFALPAPSATMITLHPLDGSSEMKKSSSRKVPPCSWERPRRLAAAILNPLPIRSFWSRWVLAAPLLALIPSRVTWGRGLKSAGIFQPLLLCCLKSAIEEAGQTRHQASALQ